MYKRQVQRLGEILDHTVDVRSTPGKGTGFSIEVPRSGAGVSVPEPILTSGLEGEFFHGTVLVIEDERSLRSALSRMLTLRGIGVIGVPTGSDAVTLIQQKDLCPDLVLCDYNLPGPMNGVESIESLRNALAWNLPAIVMTGDTRAKTMEAIASQGVSVLVKPFLGDELIQLINRLYRSSESSGHNRSARLVGQRPSMP